MNLEKFKYKITSVIVLLIISEWSFFTTCSSASELQQSTYHNALSMQGFTGVLNIPNAHITNDGDFYALYTNQKESKWRNKVPFQDNYLFSVGMFNFIELGGRFIEAPKAGRDLSANVKITTAPLSTNYPLMPVLAVGMQDAGGGATLLQSNYVVTSEEIWRFRLSAGYGTGPDRMKGGFGGVEFKAHDFLYLMGEHDTVDTNLGLRVILPQFWKVPINFTATAKTSIDYKLGNFDIAVGMTLPLDFRVRKGKLAQLPEIKKVLNKGDNPESQKTTTTIETAVNPVVELEHPIKHTINNTLIEKLIGEGFINVRVGKLNKTLVIEYENTIFNHNELDALGIVAGLVSEVITDEFDTLRLVIKKRNIIVLSITAPVNSVRSFMEGKSKPDDLKNYLVLNYNERNDNVTYIAGKNNSGILNTTVAIAPGLTTFVGTEVGAFDYILSLKPELTTQLWKGAAINARWDLPIAWSDNLDDGKSYNNYRKPAEIERLMLLQTLKIPASIMLNLGAGMVAHEQYGILNEALWNPGSGEHQFMVIQGSRQDNVTKNKSDLLLGAYRFYYSPLNLSIQGTVGKFLAEDSGAKLEVKRFWDDTSVSFYYKDMKGVDNKKWQAVGLQFNFPLTPRRDMKPVAKIQLRGSEEWSYYQETTLKNNNVNSPRGELNYLPNYALASIPQPSTSLYRSFYNRDRLSENYLKSHLERLRDSWLLYKSK